MGPKPINRIADLKEAKVEAPGGPSITFGGLSDEDVNRLLRVLPKEGWQVINNLFTSNSTTFTAPLLRPAAAVQEFTGNLLNHPAFAQG